jgi:hypothetical protein
VARRPARAGAHPGLNAAGFDFLAIGVAADCTKQLGWGSGPLFPFLAGGSAGRLPPPPCPFPRGVLGGRYTHPGGTPLIWIKLVTVVIDTLH